MEFCLDEDRSYVASVFCAPDGILRQLDIQGLGAFATYIGLLSKYRVAAFHIVDRG